MTRILTEAMTVKLERMIFSLGNGERETLLDLEGKPGQGKQAETVEIRILRAFMPGELFSVLVESQVVCENTNMNCQVHVDEPILLKPPVRERTVLYLHNLEQQVFFPVEAFYGYKAESPDSTGDVVDTIREAVIKALVPYYFVAGRIRVNEEQSRVELDCNGAGVLFAGASCDFPLRELHELRQPDSSFRKLLVYSSKVPTDLSEAPLVTIQVTRFSCGGFVIGISSNHAVYDGLSGFEFYHSIARIARGEKLLHIPNPDRSALRTRSPPKPDLEHPELCPMPDVPAKLMFTPALYDPSHRAAAPNVAFKSFRFTLGMLNDLKKVAMEDGTVTRCSSFEALVAHIWRARNLAMEYPDADTKIAKLFVVVDVRRKIKHPPLPKDYCGNAVVASACVDTTVKDLSDQPLSFCVKKVQQVIASADESYLRSALDWCELNHGNINLPGGMIITPWSKLPFHELDFGWGKPFYAAPAVHNRTEYVLVVSTCRDDSGVDVFMGFEIDKLAKLENYLKSPYL